VSLDWLAERVHPVFEMLVGPAEEGFVVRDGEPAWGTRGDYPGEIMSEIIQATDTTIGDRLVEILSRVHAWDAHDGGYDYYDSFSDGYAISEPDDPEFRDQWNAFCQALKHERRFFNSASVLDNILGPILKGRWATDAEALRVIGPEDGGTRHLYRGRVANEEAGRRSIYASPIRQLAPPEPAAARAGRMNAAGISVFYGSFDENTCVAELRIPVGGSALIGQFEILRPLRVLDLTRLEAARQRLSYFDRDYARLRGYASFIQGFHQEIRRPVIPGRESLDYLPTQIVAEYLWTQVTPQIDGLIFGSSQISDSANNIVLFPHACRVEGAEAEQPRTVRSAYVSAPDPDEDALEEHVYWEPQPPEPEPEHRARPFDDEDWFGEIFEDTPPPPPAPPILRLNLAALRRVQVEGIRYQTTTIPVSIETWTDPGF
jgi:hypothetical protein